MKKWNLIVDVSLCTNCNNCVVATQDEFMDNAFEGYSKPGAPGLKTLHVERHIRGRGAMVDVRYVPRMCNHCDDAPCLKAAPDGAIYKRDDGIVVIDPVKAKGQSDLVAACPYGAIVWNAREEVPQSWYFDAHLLDQGWSEPRCVQSCPTGALEIAKCTDDEMSARAHAEKLDVLRPELGTRPRVYYKHLGQAHHHFIAGNVTAGIDGNTENVAGASVSLYRGAELLHSCSTDAFGDFKFDGLLPGSQGYRLSAEHAQLGKAALTIADGLGESRVFSLSLEAA